jgi:iron complex transport system permease protein
MLKPTRRTTGILVVFGVILLLAMVLDIWMGQPDVQQKLPPGLVVRVLAHHLPLVGKHVLLPAGRIRQVAESIVWQLRLPEVLAAAMIGMMLALSGVAFQSLLQNPLADPYTTGVASGSALGSILIVILGGGAWLAGLAQPTAAFCGGLLTVSMVYLLSRSHGRVSTQSFLLAGTIVGTFFWSMVPLIITLANRNGDNMRDRILSTLFGSLEAIGWDKIDLLLPFWLAGTAILWLSWTELDRMSQGEETAIHLGVDIQRFTRTVILASTLMTAAAVSVGGIIAFVGFVAPHLARSLLPKSGHRVLLPASLLLGALLLVVADLISRVLLSGIEIGIVTSLIGAPFFCGMLRRRIATT